MIAQIVNQSRVRCPKKFVVWWIENLNRELIKKNIVKKNGKKNLSKQHGKAITNKQGPSPILITLVFLEKAAAKKINYQFRGKNYATDVLSFSSEDPESLGELVLCPQVLQKQSKEHGLLYFEELAYMLTHGVLHLLGYDHETNAKDAQIMFTLQDEIFDRLLLRYQTKKS